MTRFARRSRKQLFIWVSLASLCLAGCGLRVPSSTVRSATAAAEGSGGTGSSALNPSGSGSSGNGSSLNTGNSGSAPSGAINPSGGSSSGAGGSSGGGGGPSSGSGGSGGGSGGGGGTANPSASVPAGGNGGSTDVGVTANSITVGNVSDLGGPVPGLFQGGPDGTQAYFDYINSQGGIYGRQLHLAGDDDQLQCSSNEAAYQNRVGSVFAFVGSWSLDDNCGAQVMQSHTNVPMVQTYLSQQMQSLPNAYGVAPYSVDVPSGPLLYFKSKFPSAISSVGTIVGNQPNAVAAWDHEKTALQSLGYTVKYEDDFPPAQSNFTADVIRMKADGIKTVFMIAVNAPDAAIFASESAQQGFKPQLWICPICYFGSYISESGGPSSVAGQYAYLGYAQFLSDTSMPEVGLFQHWIHTAYPNFVPDEFAMYSWANAALFVHAVQQAGPHLTRKAVLAALAATNSFTDNGMVTQANINGKQPSPCYNIVQIQNGNWVKVDDPPTGFRCDGGMIP
jgi:ABC-type branched-subunit amino acid transport system substrate-binding protein